MSNSMGVGFMAVFAVSGSVVLLVHQLHKRLLSDFMKKVESEYGTILYSHGKNKIKGMFFFHFYHFFFNANNVI